MSETAGVVDATRFENVRTLRRMLENAQRRGMRDAVAAIEQRIGELEERARPWFLTTAEQYVRLQREGDPHANRGRLMQMLRRHGPVECITLLVTRPEATTGFEFLREHGRLDLSFERFVADNPAMFDPEVVTVAHGRLAVVRPVVPVTSATGRPAVPSTAASNTPDHNGPEGAGRWWASDPAERYWLEATDREDIGTDLRAPELDGGGRPNWRYSLFKETRPGDVVLHYDKGPDAGGIVGFSRVAGPWVPAPIVWAARGTFARERGDVPEERPGYAVPLEGFTRLAAPLTLARLRERAVDLRAMLDTLKRRHGGASLYFPFETAGPREPRLLQGYAFRLPAEMLRLFPELDPVVEQTGVLSPQAVASQQGDAPGERLLEAIPAEPDERTGRNPPWTRDELILALDLYLRHGRGRLPKTAPELEELSTLLNRLHRLSAREVRPDFRNPAGCYMKLMNFRRFDPEAQARGSAGLARGNHEEERVWDEYAHDPDRLAQVAAAIRGAVEVSDPGFAATAAGYEEDGQAEAPEGRVLTRLHRYRERDQGLVRARKDLSLQRNGRLACEACGFDFEARYGERGRGFIECHHTRPVHMLREGDKTHLGDLALLCANCHRMVHAVRPWLSIAELKSLLAP